MSLFDPHVNFAETPGELTRVRMLVAYDGAPFRGFAENVGVTTVAGTIRLAAEKVLGHELTLVCAGRTDRGVHGWGQVVSCDVRRGTDLVALAKSLNKMCRPHIVIRAIAEAAPDFDARFGATSRSYRYRILNQDVPNPFLHGATWLVPKPLDLRAMQAAITPLLGEHDFTSFCRKQTNAEGEIKSRVRRLLSAQWSVEDEGTLLFEISASSFCQQMVRAIVGTMVDVGHGKFTVADVKTMLDAKDRTKAGQVAPPQGLTLWHVGYDEPDAADR